MTDYSYNTTTPLAIFAEKDPDSIEDYAFNWAPWLDGDVIQTSIFLLPDGLTETNSGFTDSQTTIFVSGGAACGIYRITSRITTVGGRAMDKTIYIKGKNQ